MKRFYMEGRFRNIVYVAAWHHKIIRSWRDNEGQLLKELSLEKLDLRLVTELIICKLFPETLVF